MKNRKLVIEQLESFNNDLEMMNKEIAKIHIKLSEIDFLADKDIYEFWISKMSNFLTSKKQVEEFIKELEKELEKGDKNDN